MASIGTHQLLWNLMQAPSPTWMTSLKLLLNSAVSLRCSHAIRRPSWGSCVGSTSAPLCVKSYVRLSSNYIGSPTWRLGCWTRRVSVTWRLSFFWIAMWQVAQSWLRKRSANSSSCRIFSNKERDACSTPSLESYSFLTWRSQAKTPSSTRQLALVIIPSRKLHCKRKSSLKGLSKG